MAAIPILLLVLPVFATLAGGLLAIRFRSSLSLLVALGVGLLLGAAFLDLLPEAITLGVVHGMTPAATLRIALVSFLLFLSLQMAIDTIAARYNEHAESNKLLGRLGGGMLVFHSFRDGMAIGLSYAMSHPAGFAVAAGIVAHDIGDGMNTVILTTHGEKAGAIDYLFLAADCLAPLLGGLLTIWWTLSVRNSVVLLAAAAGFFLQMATSDFLPQLRGCVTPRKYLLPAIVSGASAIYVANLLIGRF